MLAEGNTEQASQIYREYSSYLDRGSKRNLIHTGQAARRKSRIAKLINSHIKQKTA